MTLKIDKVEEIITMVIDSQNETLHQHMQRVNSFLCEPPGFHSPGETDAIKTMRGVIGMAAIAGLLMGADEPKQDTYMLRAFQAGYIYEMEKKLDDWTRQGIFVNSREEGFRDMDPALCNKIDEVLHDKFGAVEEDVAISMSWRVGRKTAAFVRDGETIMQIFALPHPDEEAPSE